MVRRLSLALALWLCTQHAAAQELDLTWSAPSGCPDRAAAARIIERIAVRMPTRPTSIDARIEPAGDEYELHATLHDDGETSQRVLRAQRCETLLEVLAVELGLLSRPAAEAARSRAGPEEPDADPPREQAASPERRERAHTEEARGKPPSQPAPEARPAARRTVEPPRARVPLHGAVRVTAAAGTGLTPGFAPAARLALALRRARARYEVGASYGFKQTQRYDRPDEVYGRFSAIGGDLRACLDGERRWGGIALCLGVEAGVLRGEGFGVVQRQNAVRPYAAAEFALAPRFSLFGPISLWLELSGMLGLSRPSFGFENLPVLYRPAVASVRGALGFEVQFR